MTLTKIVHSIANPRALIGLELVAIAAGVITVKYCSQTTAPTTFVFYRLLFCIIILSPFAATYKATGASLPHGLRVSGPEILGNIPRAFLSFVANSSLTFALATSNVSVVMTIFLTKSLFISIFSWMFLGESISRSQWAALAMAMAGGCLVLSPEFDYGTPGGLIAAFVSAMTAAMASVEIKRVGSIGSTINSAFVLPILMLPLAAVPLAFHWQVPGGEDLGLLALAGALLAVSQIALLSAYRLTRMSSVALIEFARLLLASATAALLFSEPIAIHTIFGSLLIGLAWWMSWHFGS